MKIPEESAVPSTSQPGTPEETVSVRLLREEYDIVSSVDDAAKTDEDDLDESSVGSEQSVRRRTSILYTSPKRRTGVEMDAASRVANELLQTGKEALEAAGNMKRECKQVAHDSLQGLYETVLSLADSRARHRCNLEKERSRHAQELVRAERAHSKELTLMRQGLIKDLSTARDDISKTLKETQGVRSWLGYETEEPFRGVQEIKTAIKTLEARIHREREVVSLESRNASGDPKWEAIEAGITKLNAHTTSVSNQLDALRRTVERLDSKVSAPLETPAAAAPQTMFPDAPATTRLEEGLETLRRMTQTMLERPICSSPPPQPPLDLGRHLLPLSERLEMVSADVRELRDRKLQTTEPAAPSLKAELAIEEVKQALNTIKKGVSDLGGVERPPLGPNTYAQAAVKPCPPKLPNHALIISSGNPDHTGDDVIQRISAALDFKNTGAKVNRVRKARNQKVVLNCASKEDLTLVKERVQGNNGLNVQEPKNINPLACVWGALSVHTNEQMVELLLVQNRHLLHGVDVDRETIRVRYRKRARNPHQCHPVLELSPEIWKRFTQAGKVYLGLLRCVIEDQSPLVQCTKCLAYGHAKAVCKAEVSTCCYCSGAHLGGDCPVRAEGGPPTCSNCVKAHHGSPDLAHNAFSDECRERQKWDGIARSRVSYC